MTNYKPYLYAAFVLLLAGITWHSCERDVNDIDVATIPAAEDKRERIISGRDKTNAELAAKLSEFEQQRKVDSVALNRLKANGKQKDKLIAELEARHRKKPTLAGCDSLVLEQKGRIDSLKAEVAAHRKDSLDKANMLKIYAGHLFDKDLRIDSLNTIAKDANVRADKWEKKAKKRGKIIGWGAAILAAVGIGAAAAR